MAYRLQNSKILSPDVVGIHIKSKNPGKFVAVRTTTMVIPVYRDCDEELCETIIGPGEVAGLVESQSNLRCLPCHEEALAA